MANRKQKAPAVDVQFQNKRDGGKINLATIGEVKSVFFNVKQQSLYVYMIAREAMPPDAALQAVRVFILTKFFAVVEKLSHEEDFTSAELLGILRERVFEFAKTLDFDEVKFEQLRLSKLANTRQAASREKVIKERVLCTL